MKQHVPTNCNATMMMMSVDDDDLEYIMVTFVGQMTSKLQNCHKKVVVVLTDQLQLFDNDDECDIDMIFGLAKFEAFICNLISMLMLASFMDVII